MSKRCRSAARYPAAAEKGRGRIFAMQRVLIDRALRSQDPKRTLSGAGGLQTLTSLQLVSIWYESTLGRTTWAASPRHRQARTFQTPFSKNRSTDEVPIHRRLGLTCTLSIRGYLL